MASLPSMFTLLFVMGGIFLVIQDQLAEWFAPRTHNPRADGKEWDPKEGWVRVR